MARTWPAGREGHHPRPGVAQNQRGGGEGAPRERRGGHRPARAWHPLRRKGRKAPKEEGKSHCGRKIRLATLNRAEATIKNPHEIWQDPRTRREQYVRIIKDEASGRTVMNAVSENGKEALSWHGNNVSLNHYRHGELIWLQTIKNGPPQGLLEVGGARLR